MGIAVFFLAGLILGLVAMMMVQERADSAELQEPSGETMAHMMVIFSGFMLLEFARVTCWLADTEQRLAECWVEHPLLGPFCPKWLGDLQAWMRFIDEDRTWGF